MKSAVERIGDRVWLRTSRPTPGLGRRVRGMIWAPTQEVWTGPLRLDVCRALRAEFGDSMQIGPFLRMWAAGEVERERELAALGSTLTAVPLSRVPDAYPGMAKALAARPYQSAAVSFVATGRHVLLADEPGLGKTLEAIAGITEAGVPGPYLVACPIVAQDEWARQIARWHPDAEVHIARGSHRQRSIQVGLACGPSDWLIINTDMLRTVSTWRCRECGTEWRASDRPKSSVIDCGCEEAAKRAETIHDHKHVGLFAEPWGAIVMDESHEALVRLSGQPTQVRAGARMLPLRPDGLRLAITGTPMRGKPHQLWGTLNWLRPKEFTGFWSWAEKFFEVKQASPFGGRIIGAVRPEMSAELDRLLATTMMRRTKREVSPELPPKQYMGAPLDPRDEGSPVAVWLPMAPEQARAYREISKAGSAQIKGGTLAPVGILAEMTRLRQLADAYGEFDSQGKFRPAAPSNKLDWLIQFCRELGIIDGEGDRKIVVVSRFTSVLRVFAEALMDLGVEVCGITGKVKGKTRTAVVDAFEAPGGPRVLFLNTKAGGVAITLDAADDMIFLDETDRPDDQTQAEARIFNRRPEEKVAQRRYWYLKSLDSIDEGTAVVNARMDMDQSALLDGRRGVAYAKAIVSYLEGK